MDLPQLEHDFTHRFGWVITLVLVAGSAFMIGQSYQPRSQQNAEEQPIVQEQTAAPVIQEIQELLAGGATEAETTIEPTGSAGGLVNVNSGTLADLDTLPGIGPAKAQAIIDYRIQNGPFVRIDDLLNVSGIGPKTLEQMRRQLTL